MPEGLHIRRATASDAALLASLGARTFHDAYAGLCDPVELHEHVARTFTLAHATDALTDGRTAVFLAAVEGTPVGYAMVRNGPVPACVAGSSPVELWRIYLEQGAVGKGYGSALMRAGLAAARAMHGRTAWLGVWDRNATALAFYARWGFRAVGTHDFEFGGKVYPDLVMARSLEARGEVALREVHEADLSIFFEQQRDPAAAHMAGFPSREEEPFVRHWEKILNDETVVARTITLDEEVAGNVVSFVQFGQREVGYWIGRAYWGMGVATRALEAFLELETRRPLYAGVLAHNAGSIRVVEKCGFVRHCEDEAPAPGGDGTTYVILRLDGSPSDR